MGSMPRKLILLSIPAFFTAGWWTAEVVSQRQEQAQTKRVIASIKNQSTIHMEKHLMPVTLSVLPMTEIPEGPDELVTVKGQLKAAFDDFDNLHYEWHLAEGVELVKGQLKGNFQNPVAGHVYEVELVLKNFDKQNKRELNLQGYVLDPDGIRLGNSTLITSRPEDSMEHLAPLMMVKAQELQHELSQKRAERNPASDQ